ncbi:MAG: hypothetical protein OEL78_02130 [Hyphomicrobiales bacterium]|nr:hypothetical protein [Hyphomicrobiales bacterium]
MPAWILKPIGKPMKPRRSHWKLTSATARGNGHRHAWIFPAALRRFAPGAAGPVIFAAHFWNLSGFRPASNAPAEATPAATRRAVGFVSSHFPAIGRAQSMLSDWHRNRCAAAGFDKSGCAISAVQSAL